MSVPLHKRIRRGLRSWILVGAVRLLSRLPPGPVLALASLVGRLAWLAPTNRRQMLAHLALALPERSEGERRAIARANLVHLAWLAAEVVTVHSLDAHLDAHVSFAPGAEERVKGALALGRGIVFITGHVGNWELMARRMASAGVPCATIAKAGHDPRLTAMLEEARTEGKVEVLWRESPSTARAMIRCFRQGKLLGILIDQDTKVQGVFVPFFGRLAYTPRAAGDLAVRFKAPVLVGWTRRRGPRPGDGHEICVEELRWDAGAPDPDAESVRITAAASSVLERAIRDRPAEWVWMHERWKTVPPPTPPMAEDGVPGAAAGQPGTVPDTAPGGRVVEPQVGGASSVPKSRELSDG